MKSVWIEADRHARSAIEAEMRRRGNDDPERVRQVMSAIGTKVSVMALSLMGRDRNGGGLTAYVREIMPA